MNPDTPKPTTMHSILSRLLVKPQPMTSREATALTALLNGPLAKKALHDLDADQLAQRRAKVARLAELPRIHDAAIAKSLQVCETAARHLDRTETELRTARAALQAARSAAGATQTAHDDARHALEQELLKMADPRLSQFVTLAQLICDYDLTMKLTYWAAGEEVKDQWGDKFTRPVLGNNIETIAVARAALVDAVKQASKMRLAAVDYAQVSQALVTWCESLKAPLAALELNPPCLSADLSEVGLPFKWTGQPKVLAEQSDAVTAEPTAANLREHRKDVNPTGVLL